MDKYGQSHNKAIAINRAYHDLEFRRTFCSLKGYDYNTFEKHKTEYFFFLLNTSSKNQDEQKEIQSHINEIKKDQIAVVKHWNQQVEELGGGDAQLGKEYIEKYLDD